MIGITVLSLAAIGQQSIARVRVVPTTLPSTAPKFRLLPSKKRDQSGIVLLQEPNIAAELLKSLQAKMASSSIVTVVRKISKTNFAVSPTFDLKALREKMVKEKAYGYRFKDEGSLDKHDSNGKKDYFDEMKVGDVLAILSDSSQHYITMNEIVWPPFQREPDIRLGPLKHESDWYPGFNMIELGSPQPGYVNIPFQVFVNDTVGLLWQGIGSHVVVDGLSFTVLGQSKVGLGELHPFRVHVRQEGTPGSWSYSLSPRWSNGDSMEDSRKEFLADLKRLRQISQHRTLRTGSVKDFIVDCGQPFKFWKGIEIERTTKISGYYSHVKIP